MHLCSGGGGGGGVDIKDKSHPRPQGFVAAQDR